MGETIMLWHARSWVCVPPMLVDMFANTQAQLPK